MTDEHFIVWMRNSGLPTFRKLWGKIEQDLQPGKYQVVIDNQYTVKPYNGRKLFVITTTNSFGGSNHAAAIIYIIVGCFCGVATMFFGYEYFCKAKSHRD